MVTIAEPGPPSRPSTEDSGEHGPGRAEPWFAVGVFVAVALGLLAVTRLSVALLPFAPVPSHQFPDYRWFEGWTRWDTGWYWSIARDGYTYSGPGQQSPVAFFPAYPAAMRVVGLLTGNVMVAGVLVTLAAGLAALVLLHRWCKAALGGRTARLAVVLLALAPFAFYLFGAVYSDALFLVAVIAAFHLLERDHVALSGLAGAVATATRPVGIALVVGLVIRALELRGVLPGAPARFTDGEHTPPAGPPARTPLLPRAVRLRAISWRDSPVLLSALGLGAYCALLWYRFGDPLAFTKVASAPGWSRTFSIDTVLKKPFLEVFRNPDLSAVHAGLALQAVLTVTALLLVPAVVRRLGWGYGAFVVIVLAIPALSSNNFVGTGRYVLAAFPCFAVAADLLVSRAKPLLTGAVLVFSGANLVLMHSLFVRWYFLS